MKRLFDIVAASIATILLSPLMLAFAIAIRIESRGPAIFHQRRAGLAGKPFTMLKFRSMRTDVDPYGGSPQSAGDPRLTRVGRWLRETSLDELPQLFNVLAGQMSLVGPRPLYERQAEQWNDRQRRRLEVLPGLTGFAQVYGRGGLTHEEKIELDVEYVEKQSFRLDMKILCKTVATVLGRREEIYEQRYSRDKERENDS